MKRMTAVLAFVGLCLVFGNSASADPVQPVKASFTPGCLKPTGELIAKYRAGDSATREMFKSDEGVIKHLEGDQRSCAESGQQCEQALVTCYDQIQKEKEKTAKKNLVWVCSKDDTACSIVKGRASCQLTLTLHGQTVTRKGIFVKTKEIEKKDKILIYGACAMKVPSPDEYDEMARLTFLDLLDRWSQDPNFAANLGKIQEERKRVATETTTRPASEYSAAIDRIASLETRVSTLEKNQAEDHAMIVADHADVQDLKFRMGHEETTTGILVMRTNRLERLQAGGATVNPALPPPQVLPPASSAPSALRRFEMSVYAGFNSSLATAKAPSYYGPMVGVKPTIRIGGDFHFYADGAVTAAFGDFTNPNDSSVLPLLTLGAGLEYRWGEDKVAVDIGGVVHTLFIPGGMNVGNDTVDTINWGGGGQFRLIYRFDKYVGIFAQVNVEGSHAWWLAEKGAAQHENAPTVGLGAGLSFHF